jgi:3D (Asp-Asp-Asp) domain-containing protein
MRSLMLVLLLCSATADEGRWVWAKLTGYTPWDAIDSHSGFQDGYTATMVNTRSSHPNHIYGIAANPRHLPYGTQVYVPGYWEALQRNRTSVPREMTRVDDTGSRVRSFRPHSARDQCPAAPRGGLRQGLRV